MIGSNTTILFCLEAKKANVTIISKEDLWSQVIEGIRYICKVKNSDSSTQTEERNTDISECTSSSDLTKFGGKPYICKVKIDAFDRARMALLQPAFEMLRQEEEAEATQEIAIKMGPEETE